MSTDKPSSGDRPPRSTGFGRWALRVLVCGLGLAALVLIAFLVLAESYSHIDGPQATFAVIMGFLAAGAIFACACLVSVVLAIMGQRARSDGRLPPESC